MLNFQATALHTVNTVISHPQWLCNAKSRAVFEDFHSKNVITLSHCGCLSSKYPVVTLRRILMMSVSLFMIFSLYSLASRQWRIAAWRPTSAMQSAFSGGLQASPFFSYQKSTLRANVLFW